MRPKKRDEKGSGDLFRAQLDQIINMQHELVQLADRIDWDWIDEQVADCFSAEGRPGTQTRFMIGTRATQVRSQQQRQRGWKLYSLHAPEVECIAKGKAHKPYEFGCKVSITTTNARSPGGQFVLHSKAFHGRPYDGHTLVTVITETQALTGVEIKRAYVDKGYVGHNAPKPLRVYRSGQKRGVHGQIKKELRRRAAIEPVIGHLKSEGHLDRNYLKGRHGDQANAVLTATGHNLRLILRWLRELLCKLIATLIAVIWPTSALRTAS